MLEQNYLDEVAEQAELKTWTEAEYHAGRAARISGQGRSNTETVCWRMGWQDANVLLKQQADGPDASKEIAPPHRGVLCWSLYALGQLARRNGLPFGDDSSEVWKRGWIQMDIHLAVTGPRGATELILFRNCG